MPIGFKIMSVEMCWVYLVCCLVGFHHQFLIFILYKETNSVTRVRDNRHKAINDILCDQTFGSDLKDYKNNKVQESIVDMKRERDKCVEYISTIMSLF